MTARTPLRLALRMTATSPLATALLVLLVAALSLLGALAPAMLLSAQTDSLRYALAAERPTSIDPLFDLPGTARHRPGEGATASTLEPDIAAVWGGSLGQLDAVRDGFGPHLRAVVGSPRVAATVGPGCARLPDASCSSTVRPKTELLLTADPRFAQRVDWIEGDAPAVDPVPGAPLQFALGADAAAAMAWPVGELRVLEWGGDPAIEVVLSGVYRPLDADDTDWAHLPNSLRHETLDGGLDRPTFQAMAFVAAGELERLEPLGLLARTTSWFPLRIDRIDIRDADAIAVELRAAGALPVRLDTVTDAPPRDTIVTSSLALRIADSRPRTDALAALGGLLASGPLAVAVLALALGARTLAQRRVVPARLAAARGASAGALVGVLGLEGLVIGLVGAAVGTWIATALTGPPVPAQLLAPAVVALAPAVVLGWAGATASRGRVVDAVLVSRWRLAGELAVIAVAGATALVVLRRGAGSTGIDPLLTALPVLLCAAGGLVALRVLPVLVGVVGRLAPRARGILPMLGPALVRARDGLRVAPVLAVVVGVAIAVFSVGFAATIDAGIRTAARSAVGADLRISAAYITERELAAIGELDGVDASAPVYADHEATAEVPDGDADLVVYVIDAAELRAVQGDQEGAIPMPAAMTADSGDGVPVVMSDALAARIGDGEARLRDQRLDVVAVAPSSTPLGPGRSWIAVDRVHAERLLSRTFSPAVVLLAIAPGADPDVVTAAARGAISASSTASTPAEVAAVRAQDPALVAALQALIAAVAVVGALLVIALATALLLGAPARRRLIALLRTQGVPRRAGPAIVLWELAPAVLVAVPIGLLVGIALPWVVVSAIDLTGFVGGAEQPGIRLGGALPLLVAAAAAGVALLAMLTAALIAARGDTTRTLRSPDEGG